MNHHAAPPTADHLIHRLPAVRGRLSANAPLAALSWFRVGGPAEVLFRPADAEDLAAFLAACPAEVALTVIGVGSNLLIRDGGVPGVVIRLGGPFAGIQVNGVELTVGAGALDATVAQSAAQHGIAGLEFLSGIPGTIGGALRMNAGAYGRDLAQVLVAAEALDRQGRHHRLSPAEMGFGYRTSGVPADWLFIRAQLAGEPDEPVAIAARLDQIAAQRASTQPVRARTGGSTFANPGGSEPGGVKAWQLIDRAGCRGLRRGEAQVSEKHCNFLLNLGAATAADLEDLGEQVRQRVLETSGVTLEWEIRRIGVRAAPAPQLS